MRIANYHFKPGFWPTLVTIILLPVLVRLGVWQLDRAEEKRQLYAQQQQQIEQGPLVLNKALPVEEIIPYQPVEITGHFIKDRVMFLDNKPYKGVHGYHVITPFMISDSKETILVNRGWVAMPVHREDLPEIETSEEIQTISGILKVPSYALKLGKLKNDTKQWPWRIQWIEIETIEKQLNMKLLPFIVLLDKTKSGKLIQDWKITVSPPEKNISYAVQWFALAVALLIIYIVVNSKKTKVNDNE
jgi:surfeit locus 1 family protein